MVYVTVKLFIFVFQVGQFHSNLNDCAVSGHSLDIYSLHIQIPRTGNEKPADLSRLHQTKGHFVQNDRQQRKPLHNHQRVRDSGLVYIRHGHSLYSLTGQASLHA